jgi:ATP-dependent DNA helicase UvrD/PcrA
MQSLLTNKLILASAGSGKTTKIVGDAINDAKDGKRVLILTYTQNNQKEILNRICQIHGVKPSSIRIKGWFTFLLEDMIRPYQTCIFEERISNILFNNSNPHKRRGRNISGRSEKTSGEYSVMYYLGTSKRRVHTTFISQLAARIDEETRPTNSAGRKIPRGKGKSILRLEEIYDSIHIDEVQDLVGWDYRTLALIANSSKINFTCVGDFRQTIYTTAITSKTPKGNDEKLQFFQDEGFDNAPLAISHRCVQAICSFADEIHTIEGYTPTVSMVGDIPEEHSNHIGVFAVRQCDVEAYLATFNPVILRATRKSGTEVCKGRVARNFGEAKGLGFDRVLIIPTGPYKQYLSGNSGRLEDGRTDQSRNKLYVAITRARYSTAFLYDGNIGVDGMTVWEKDS